MLELTAATSTNVWRQITTVLKEKRAKHDLASFCPVNLFASKSLKTQTGKFQCDSLVLVYEDLYQSIFWCQFLVRE